jgi:hypothetical protein
MTCAILLLFAAAILYGADPEVEKEVPAAMDSSKQAMMAKDRGTLQKLFHQELTYTHSSGNIETKAEAIKAVVEGCTKIEGIDQMNNNIRVYGNTALVNGKVDFRKNPGGQVSKAHLGILHVCVIGSTGWQMVAQHALRLTPQ